MMKLNRWVRRLAGAEPPELTSADGVVKEELARTNRAMVRALAFGLELRDAELDIVRHCTLVADFCGTLGRFLDLSLGEMYIVDTAARLHEIGMFMVPTALLKRPAPLSAEELARVRSQARLSAEIAATMHHPRVARLIEHQYDDYSALVGKLDESDLLRAGIVRVADLIAAVTRPRPYQGALSWEKRVRLLRAGAGTHFHPRVVECALEMPV
jgi:response regulator RpfG family c-di-GMP phosphodiesterase